RQEGSMRKGHGVWQSPQPSCDPRPVLLRKLFRLPDAAARRHRKQAFTAGSMDPQRIAARPAMAANAYRVDLAVECDCYCRRFAGAAEKQGAQRKVHFPPRIRGRRQCATFTLANARSTLGYDL